MEIYADMVKIHYEFFKNKDKYKKHIPSNLKEITKYSDKDSIVFENKDEIVIAMRGLQPGRSFDDVVIGAEIFFEDAYQESGADFDTSTKKKKGISLLPNKYGEILLREQSKIDELKKEYPNKKIVLSGHSRGGRKAIDLGEKNQLEYHAFQPAEMNRMANPLLSMGTSMLNPTGGLTRGFIESDIWNELFTPGLFQNNIGNEMMIEFGSMKEFEKNIVSSATSSSDFTTAGQSFLGRTLIPRVIERSIDLKDGYDPLRLPSNVEGLRPEILKRELRKEFGKNTPRLDGLPDETFIKRNIDNTLSFLTTKGKEKRKAPTESISNIYKTSNDLVSKGYQHTELVKPKQYAYGMFDHYALGDHSIDHFVSKEMFDSVNENRPIEEIEDVEIDSLEDNFSPPSDITPSSSLGYTVDNVSLCRKYPNYSPHCKKILR